MTRRITVRIATILLCGMACIGLLAPLLCSEEGGLLLPYSDTSIDKTALNWKPPSSKHPMGSSKLGKDVAAGMIYGARSAAIVGGLSVVLALLIGTLLGMVAGYYQDMRCRANIWQIAAGAIGGLLTLFYAGLAAGGDVVGGGMALAIGGLTWWGIKALDKAGGPIVAVPVDTLVGKLIEVRKSIPLIYIVLMATAVIAEPSVWWLAVIIGLTIWTPFARQARAATMGLVAGGFVEGAQAIGSGDRSIMLRHILRNIAPQLAVVAAFAMSSAILLESALSFLGLGVPAEHLTWGSMLAEAKQQPRAWWMAVWPGLALFVTVWSLNILGQHWTQRGQR